MFSRKQNFSLMAAFLVAFFALGSAAQASVVTWKEKVETWQGKVTDQTLDRAQLKTRRALDSTNLQSPSVALAGVDAKQSVDMTVTETYPGAKDGKIFLGGSPVACKHGEAFVRKVQQKPPTCRRNLAEIFTRLDAGLFHGLACLSAPNWYNQVAREAREANVQWIWPGCASDTNANSQTFASLEPGTQHLLGEATADAKFYISFQETHDPSGGGSVTLGSGGGRAAVTVTFPDGAPPATWGDVGNLPSTSRLAIQPIPVQIKCPAGKEWDAERELCLCPAGTGGEGGEDCVSPDPDPDKPDVIDGKPERGVLLNECGPDQIDQEGSRCFCARHRGHQSCWSCQEIIVGNETGTWIPGDDGEDGTWIGDGNSMWQSQGQVCYSKFGFGFGGGTSGVSLDNCLGFDPVTCQVIFKPKNGPDRSGVAMFTAPADYQDWGIMVHAYSGETTWRDSLSPYPGATDILPDFDPSDLGVVGPDPNGTPWTPSLSISSTSLDFGEVDVFGERELSITVTNQSTEPWKGVDLELRIQHMSFPVPFEVFHPGAGSGTDLNIPPGTSRSLVVRFQPTAPGITFENFRLRIRAEGSPYNWTTHYVDLAGSSAP